jgi:hypothetical protein
VLLTAAFVGGLVALFRRAPDTCRRGR